LADAGVRIPELGRLRDEIKVLRAVADAGIFPEAVVAQRIVGNAILDSIEVADIAQFLPAARSSEMASQLQAAQKGRSQDARRGQAAYRFQTQFWLGAILDQGGLCPTVPTAADGRSPDFLVEQGVSRYGIEIKRPEKHEGLSDLIDDGAKQLRAYDVMGAIVVDLTEVLGLPGLGWVSEAEAVKQRDEYIAEAQRLLNVLKTQAYDAARHALRPGYERVNGIMILARGWSWIVGDSRSLVVFAVGAATAFVPGRGHTLAYWHAKGLLNGIVKGLRAAAFEFDELREREFPL
jgi:hypothetical protein